MRLDEYKWSHNPRGLHNKGAPMRWNVDQLRPLHLGWAKMAAIGGEYIDDIPKLLAENITPIVRIYRPRFGAGSAQASGMMDYLTGYFQAGVRWFEFYNEPNLDTEWPNGIVPSYANIPGVIAPLMENWLTWAETIIKLGAYPAFPALAETVGREGDVSSWLLAMMTYLSDNQYDRFRDVIDNGLWCATHPYFYNHFYQQGRSALDVRSTGEESASEGGWHFEYPYDPISQSTHPGMTAISGPADFPRGDVIGLTGMGHAFMEYLADMFGGGAVPVVGTEGGITPVPNSAGDTVQTDTRYPAYNGVSHAEATLAAFNWMAAEGPAWMFGVTLWKEDNYFPNGGTGLAAQKLSSVPPIYKNVPQLEALDSAGPRALKGGKGPGPIHATPDYHFVLFSSDYPVEWFFSSGRAYWEQFRPNILIDPGYLAFVPSKKSVALTVLSTADQAGYLLQQVKERWKNVWFDLIVTDTEDKLSAVLKDRVATGRRFG